MAEGGGAKRSIRRVSRPCLLLIVISGMERFAFKGVASNLVTYLTDIVKLSNSSAAKMVNSWCGFTSIMPLLVAPLADSYWDRFSTILASSFLYLVGLGALTSTALVLSRTPWNKTATSWFLFWSLCLVSVGQGGYNPSLQAFGTDQLESCDEELPCTNNRDDNKSKSDDQKSFFFQMWYLGICCGCLLGVLVMSYIQDTYGWVLGFSIPALAMLASIFFFLCGTRIYVYKDTKKPEHNPIGTFLKSAAARLKKGGVTLRNKKSESVGLELQGKPFCHLQSLHKENASSVVKPENTNHMRANARVVLRLLPIWTMLLMFAVIFQQPATFFTKQGMTMKRTIGGGFKVPPATLQSAITLSIILLMPLYDVLLVPFARLITREEKGLSVMQRMGIGMILSIISMILAAFVETKRLEVSHRMRVHSSEEAVPLCIFWLLPQYILLGVADIFTVVGMQEFFYNEVPLRMRTMGFALYTSVFGVGSFMSALLISLVEVFTSSSEGHNWFSDDMNESRLDKYYWLLAILSTVSFLLYAVLCKFHRSRSEQDLEDNTCP